MDNQGDGEASETGAEGSNEAETSSSDEVSNEPQNGANNETVRREAYLQYWEPFVIYLRRRRRRNNHQQAAESFNDDNALMNIDRGIPNEQRFSSTSDEEEPEVLSTDENLTTDESDEERTTMRSSGAGNCSQRFDTELPTEHSYLGHMETVSGIDYFEPGKRYRIPIGLHQSVVYPGEILPMMMTSDFSSEHESPFDGKSFGLVFTQFNSTRYGVTCQIFEKSHMPGGNVRIKLRAHQRFRVCSKDMPTYLSNIRYWNDHDRLVEIEILPELTLPNPLLGVNHFNVDRHRWNKVYGENVRRFHAHSTPWPKYLYDKYDMERIITKVRLFLAGFKIDNMPTDPVQCSFWCARNMPLEPIEHEKIFMGNFVEVRMLIIAKKLDSGYIYCCRGCHHKIAKFGEVFPMSKHGVQASYCNPHGIIHETVTVFSILDKSLNVDRVSSSEFSWFPGYSWRIASCKKCNSHIGWKFTADKENLWPHTFYGLAGKSIMLQL